MNKKSKIYQLHPLYLTTVTTDNNYELLVIPKKKNNEYRYHSKTLADKEPDNFNLDIGKVQFNDKQMINIIYGIENWIDMKNFLTRNIQDNIQHTIDRLFKFCWKELIKEFKQNINIILDCYVLYFTKFNITFTENKLNKILHNIKTKNNIENTHQLIINELESK